MTTSTPAGYTDDEVTQAVEGIVLSTVRRPIDTLGVRRTDITFTDVQQAAAGVFLLYRDAPFYVLFLATQRVIEALRIEAALIDSVLASIDATGRYVLPITDISTLANAQSALAELESAVGQRQQAFQNIESVPAYQRYQSNINQFLTTAGTNVKQDGQIVMTPQEARSVLPSLITQLEESHVNLVTSNKLLANALNDFSSLNLPSLVAESVISASRQVLTDHLSQLNTQTPEERLTSLRELVLDLLTQKGVIKQFASFQGPTSSFSISGVGSPYSDRTHLATPAKSVASFASPYALRPGKNILDFYLDGPLEARFTQAPIGSITIGTNIFEANFNFSGDFTSFGISIGDIVYPRTGSNAGSRWIVTSVTPTTLIAVGDHTPITQSSPQIEIWPSPSTSVPLASSALVKLDGYLPEAFVIDSSNDAFIFKAESSTIIVALTHGTRTAAQIASNINAAIAFEDSSLPVSAKPYISPLRYDGIVTLSSPVGGITRFTVAAGNLDGLNISIGSDSVQVLTGPDTGSFLPISAIGSSPIHYVEVTGTLTSLGTRQEIQIGASARKLRISCSVNSTCLAHGTGVTISLDATNTAATTLGFTPGFSSTSKAVRVIDLVKDFNQRTLNVVASSQIAIDYSGPIHSDPLSPSKAVLATLTGVGDIVATGTSIVLTTEITVGAAIGDTICLRTSATPNALFTISAVTEKTIIATGAVATDSALQITFEVGPSLSMLVSTRTLTVNSPNPNAGTYEVVAQGDVPFELFLAISLPIRKTSNAQPIQMFGSLGAESVVFSSIKPDISSNIRVLGSAADLFYPGGVSALGVGTTPWFNLPTVPLGLQSGDFIETFSTSYMEPASYTIESLDGLIVKISPEISSTPTWMFSDVPPPFARLRAGTVDASTAFSKNLMDWLSTAVNQPSYFVDLNRFINPLLVNSTPTAVEVNDAKLRVLDLAKLLTRSIAIAQQQDAALTLEAILTQYNSNAVAAIDNLLTTFTSKGANRAVDILLTANFTGFFGLTVDTSSYSGTMLLAAREVARNDMPINKINRADAIRGSLLSASVSDDYDFSRGDIETGLTVDPPTEG